MCNSSVMNVNILHIENQITQLNIWKHFFYQFIKLNRKWTIPNLPNDCVFDTATLFHLCNQYLHT